MNPLLQIKEITEIWKDVPGYEGIYQVNNIGVVKSLDRFVVFKNGQRSFRSGKTLVSIKTHKRCHKVFVSKNGKTRGMFVHRIVAMAFIPNPENKPQVNHINGNRSDNGVENLEWVTGMENIIHALQTGLHNNRGQDSPRAKLTDAMVIDIRNDSRPQKEIATQYNVSCTCIRDIKSRKRWKHLN